VHGWTTLDCWGVHPTAGTVRVDFCCALMMSTDLVSCIIENRMRFTNTTFQRGKPSGPSGAVPLWLPGR
jgi:hypothetical protein